LGDEDIIVYHMNEGHSALTAKRREIVLSPVGKVFVMALARYLISGTDVWLRGHVEGVTGWSIGSSRGMEENTEREVGSLYDKLEFVVLPFINRSLAFAEVMRSAIALNGPLFNSQRMLSQ